MTNNIITEFGSGSTSLYFDMEQFLSLKHPSPLDVAIQTLPDMPIDWAMILATFVATLVGAVVAFFLNWLHEKSKKDEEEREKISKFIVRCGININRFVCFKYTFLKAEYKPYWERLREFVERFQASEDKNTFLQEWNQEIIPLVSDLSQKSVSLGGLTKQWDKPSFFDLNGEELFFVKGSASDVIRLSEETNEQIRGVGRTIQAHNEMWEMLRDPMRNGLTVGNLGEFYHLLSLNENLEDFVDRSLCYSKYSMDMISHWWNENNKKKQCAMFSFSNNILEMIPDPENYKNILYPRGHFKTNKRK